MEVDPAPGTLGQMAPRDSQSYGDSSGGYGFEDEPPLLEGELDSFDCFVFVCLIYKKVVGHLCHS